MPNSHEIEYGTDGEPTPEYVIKQARITAEDERCALNSYYTKRLLDIFDGALDAARNDRDGILGLIRTSRGTHGRCNSPGHLACSACHASDKLTEILSAWKGPMYRVYNASDTSKS